MEPLTLGLVSSPALSIMKQALDMHWQLTFVNKQKRKLKKLGELAGRLEKTHDKLWPQCQRKCPRNQEYEPHYGVLPHFCIDIAFSNAAY